MTATKSKPYIYEGGGSAIDDYNKPRPQNPQPTTAKNWGLFDANNLQHKRIQSDLRQANIVVKHDRHGEVADMLGWFDRFLKSNKCPVKKPLKKMTPEEVSKIIVALDKVVIWKNSI